MIERAAGYRDCWRRGKWREAVERAAELRSDIVVMTCIPELNGFLYRRRADNVIEVARILHDSRDLQRPSS